MLLKDGRLIDGVAPMPTHDVTQSSENVAITGETVTWADGAAGTTQQIKLVNDGIMNATGAHIGKDGDTSITWTTGTVLTIEVDWKFRGHHSKDNDTARLATLGNGYYMVDYENGYILGKNAITTSTATDTIAYKIRLRTVTISGSGSGGTTDVDITKIGGVAVVADDGAFTAGTSTGIVAFGLADETSTDSVDEGDVGALRMTLDRKQIMAGAFVDDAALAGGKYTLVVGARADETATDSVDEGDAGYLRMTLNRRLITAGQLLDDSALGIGTDYVTPIGGLADETATDSVDEGDVGAVRMTLTRKLFTAACQIHDAVASGYINVMGATARAAQQTAVAAADAVGLVTNLFGELVIAGYDWASGTIRTTEADPISDHHVEETLINATNITTNTTTYAYFDMDGFKNFSLQGETSGAAPTDVLTVTVEGTNQDDGTAPASCVYQDVTNALFTVASAVDTDFFWLCDTQCAFKFIRVKYVTSNGGGGDADLTVYIKKMY
uniref:Uncharacterized protein n=1 Tax=viral metagenome TaxID=1070528 RepID=A0A6M3Y3I3_9ZZZZ